MSLLSVLTEPFTHKRKIRELEKELHVHIHDYVFGFVVVERGSMVKSWGQPILRHSGDWYDLGELRRRAKNEIEGGNR